VLVGILTLEGYSDTGEVEPAQCYQTHVVQLILVLQLSVCTVLYFLYCTVLYCTA